MFRDSFKYYKSKKPPPSFEDVIDVDEENCTKVIQAPLDCVKLIGECTFKPVSSWQVYKFPEIPGLVLIRNPFTSAGQRYWITKCLRDYSKKPNKLNIDAHGLLDDNETWWDVCTSNNERARKLVTKLRWATLGYHHNWDTKYYSEDFRTDMPEELLEMTRGLADAVGFPNFMAEAAIINYYRMDSTLAGHVDHSELNMEAPLLSISFGQMALFLIGGLESDDPANAIFLRSGDVVIMSGESRLRYHGVPKILRAQDIPWDDHDSRKDSETLVNSEDWQKARNFISDTRININVRQVLHPGQTSLLKNS